MPVSYVDISVEDSGQRIDNFLMRVCKGVPRSHVYRIVRSGEVRVNGGRIKANYRLQANDRVRVPPIRTRAEVEVRYKPETADLLSQAVIFEDDDYLVLNKPEGMAVHGGSSISAGAVEILRAETGNERLELVHRLDRGTSGCLMFAKRRASLVVAQEAFRQRTVKKIYETIVLGQWPKDVRTVQLKLKKYVTSWGERRVRVDSHGQTARTDFEIVGRAKQATRLRVSLHTGRTHQIRVHTSATGHTIVGDDKYGPEAKNTNSDAQSLRLCLHAVKLQVPLPNRTLRFESPVEAQMQSIWDAYAAKGT